jgi:hypothetical protein
MLFISCTVALLLIVTGMYSGKTETDVLTMIHKRVVVDIMVSTCTHNNSDSIPLQNHPVSEKKDEEKEEKEEKKTESNEVIISHQATPFLKSIATNAFFHYQNAHPVYIILDKPIKPPRYSA